MYSNTTGNYNTSSGYKSLRLNTTGGSNTAYGTHSLYSNTTGNYNVASGSSSLRSNTTGDNNTVLGYASLYANTTGTRNIAIGYRAYDVADTEDDNLAIGYDALGGAIAGGEFNVAIGNYSLDAATSGDNNTATGYDALTGNTTGADNTALGYDAGDVITTGSQNVIIGSGSDPSANSGANQIVIGYGASGTGDNQIALGNTSITHIKAQVTSITAYSDSRIKRDIRNNDLGLAFINKLRTVKYKLKNPADYPLALRDKRFTEGNEKRPQDDEKVYDGLIAQEVKAVMDDLGIEWSGWSKNDSDGKQGIQYGALTVPLIKAVQEQQGQIEELKSELKSQYEKLTKQNQDLLKMVSNKTNNQGDFKFGHKNVELGSEETYTGSD